MRIGVKVGSNIVADANNGIREDVIRSICDQLAKLKKKGHEVFLVSSGAIACGPKEYHDKCVKASIGQPKLMRIYDRFFEEWGINSSQLLYVDFNLHPPYNKHTKFVLEEILRNDSIPIINANDPVDDYEAQALVQCADNDILFKKVCLLVGVDVAIIGFGEEGLYDSKGEVVSVATSDRQQEFIEYAQGGSDLGHGEKGMATKVECIFELVENGVYSALVPAYIDNFLLKAMEKEPEFGTVFVSPFEEHNS